MSTITEFTWTYLTGTINEIKTPNNFIRSMLFKQHETQETEDIEVGYWVGARQMAPFVSPGAGAKIVSGVSQKARKITAPNIRIKRPFTAPELMFKRLFGTPIHVTGGEVRNGVEIRVAKDLAYMKGMIDDTIEWMCCQALTGVVTYNIAGADESPGDAFTIDFQRPAGHTIVNSGTSLWTNAASDPYADLLTARELISNAIGGDVTDVVMGKAAAAAFRNHATIAALLDNRRKQTGILDLTGGFNADGAFFMGNIFGVNWWQYGRTVNDPWGASVNLIPTNAAFMISNSSQAENSLQFGAIVDLTALEEGSFVGEYFSKSWMENDPSGRQVLATSRPFPLMKRPESIVQYTVV